MKDWFKRSLTRAFGRAAARDRLLADLYVAVREETYSDLVVTRARALAYTYHDSYEVAQCIGVMLDYIAEADSSHRAIGVSKSLLRLVSKGPVFEVIMGRIGHLHHCASIQMKINREAALILNRMRLNNDSSKAGIIGMYLYNKDTPRRTVLVRPRPLRISPEKFQEYLQM